ncbi:MAG: NADH-quinone oxidoreductase subunit N [Chthoniobacterales bacterium]|nr:NADH-quinone oxidoreductase subunit N [Chthoniobacterales bacterium]
MEAVLVCYAFLLLLVEAFNSRMPRRYFGWAAVVGTTVVFFMTFFVDSSKMNPEAGYYGFYAADTLAILFKRFILLVSVCVLIMALEFAPVLVRYLPVEKPDAGSGEMYSLVLFACAGMMWMASAQNFVMIFVSVELVTITFYVMVAMMRGNRASLEAGIKFLILGAIATSLNVYGIAWIFGTLGTTELPEIGAILQSIDSSLFPSLLFGFGLIFAGISFKVAAFPFQFWVPDVYQGAPTPVTAFLSVGSKASAFVVLMRVLESMLSNSELSSKILFMLSLVAGVTILMGNLSAIPQTNFKRLLAYSSIAHAGYLLMGAASIVSGNSGPAIAYYLMAYLISNMLAFGVLLVVGKSTGSDELVHFNGLGKKSPWLATALTLAVLSLAGLPFTVGFFGKFFIFSSALQAQQFILVGIGILGIGCGFYYYLKVIRAMFWLPASKEQSISSPIEISKPYAVMLILLSISLIIFGVYPEPIFNLIP